MGGAVCMHNVQWKMFFRWSSLLCTCIYPYLEGIRCSLPQAQKVNNSLVRIAVPFAQTKVAIEMRILEQSAAVFERPHWASSESRGEIYIHIFCHACLHLIPVATMNHILGLLAVVKHPNATKLALRIMRETIHLELGKNINIMYTHDRNIMTDSANAPSPSYTWFLLSCIQNLLWLLSEDF